MTVDGRVLPSGRENRLPSWHLDSLILGMVVFYACLFGIYTRPVGFLSTVWPANAVMLGFLLLRPDAARASGWLTAAAAYLVADLVTGASLTKAVLLNLANLTGVGAAYLVCIRFPADAIRLRQPGSMLYIALASATGAAAAGVGGAIINPVLFNGGWFSGGLYWFATEFVNYLAILPVMLSWPSFEGRSWRLGRARAGRKGLAALLPARYWPPGAALALSCLAATVIGGPGAVAFPVPALLWCGLICPVFPTAVLTLLFGLWSLVAVSAGYLPDPAGAIDEMSLVSIRLGASLIALAPVTLATVMQGRDELVDELIGSHRRLDLALEAGGIVGTWELDISPVRTGDAHTVADMLGMKPENARRGRDDMLLAAVHSADRDRVFTALKDAIANRTDYQCRFRTVTPEGKVRWLIASGKPVEGRQGEAERLAGIVIDVTEHAETEAELRGSNLRFHIVTESIPQIVWSTDAEGNHDYFNHRWTEFTGIETDTLDAETWKVLVHPDDWPAVDAAWRDSLVSGKTYDIDYRFRYHDGTYRWLKVLAKPIRDTDGNVTRWYGTALDIDDAKRLAVERELVAHELDHRIKNLFTLVNSLVSLSVREEPALRPLAGPLSVRLNALHQAHSLVRRTPDSGTCTMQALLRQLLRPYSQQGAGNIVIGGMDVAIDAGAFKSMALVAHELITNSAKYGALSETDGRLGIEVSVGDEHLTITWEEQFPEKPDFEEKSGFGSTLIRTIVEMQLRGSMTHALRRDGLTVVIDLPASLVSVPGA